MAKGIGATLNGIALRLILRFCSAVNDILNIIDTALRRKGLSAAAASKLAVGNASLIKNMRQTTGSPKRFNAYALQKLAEVLDLEFYFGEEREESVVHLPAGFSERTVEPLATTPTRHEALEMGFLPIPYHVAAAPDFRGVAPVALARGWLKASGMANEGLAFLPVIKSDMSPSLQVGALALIDTNHAGPKTEGIWALGVRGQYCFARIQRPSEDIIVLKIDRPDEPVQIFKGDEMAAIKILGRVVWVTQQP